MSSFLYMIGFFVRPQTQRERNVVWFSAAVCGEEREEEECRDDTKNGCVATYSLMDAYVVENTAGNARRNFQPTYRDIGWKNRDLGTEPARPLSHEHIENFTKDLLMWRGPNTRKLIRYRHGIYIYSLLNIHVLFKNLSTDKIFTNNKWKLHWMFIIKYSKVMKLKVDWFWS